MARKSEKDVKMESIKEEFERIQETSKGLDLTKYFATEEDLPDLGEIEIYNYDLDLTTANDEASDMLESLVDLYLGDSKVVMEHNYIKQKMKQDASIYAETMFLGKMTRKNYLTQLRQIDNGDNSARMHEVVNQTVGQMRENIKFISTQRTELEKFYKEIRKDLGLTNVTTSIEVEVKEELIQEEEINKVVEDDKQVVDARSLNDMIDKILKNKD